MESLRNVRGGQPQPPRFVWLAVVVALCAPTAAWAQTEYELRATVESDLRATIPGNDMPDDAPEYAFARTDNSARLTAAFSWGSVGALADLAVVYSGRSDVGRIEHLMDRARVDPYYFESDAFFVEIIDFVLPGMDLRIGRQLIQWGSADMFNPTSVINGYDLEDPIDFGRQVANEAAVLSIHPDWSVEGDEAPVLDEVSLTLVAVPVFRSGLIPDSALTTFESPKQFSRFARSDVLRGLIGLQQTFEERGGTVEYRDIWVEEPTLEAKNAQFGARLTMSVMGLDLSAMGYTGYDHNLQARDVLVDGDLLSGMQFTEQVVRDLGTEPPGDSARSILNFLDILGDLTGNSIFSDVTLFYPKVNVVGGDLATSVDFLGGLGLWAEFAMTFHDGVGLAINIIDQDDLAAAPGDPADIEVVDEMVKPGRFWKLTAGMDYTITKWWYVNVQYLRGFVDEFGAENLHDYVVAGADFKTFDEQVLLRAFGILQLQDRSFVAFPQLSFKFWQNTELVAGALLHGGQDDSKFGHRTAGANVVFLKGRYTF